ncbi:MAG TPA: NADH-quinone oxidoreductase subunit G [Actinomycetes bacterium]|nr:NADH-quinone oxidoreductase subunit G [Actinomycetes bacterium]
MTDQQQVTVTIDGRELSVPKGSLVIRAAERIGITIPRFCDHRLLAPLGACRQCIVEIEGQRKPMTACTTTVTDGMVVRTQLASEIARGAQEATLEFLLINHPLDCPMCDKGGECPLQDQTLAHGPAETRFSEAKRRFRKPIKVSETVLLDRERCVLCARCTRFAAEIAGDPFIELYERGSLEQVATDPDEPFSSYFSGNTVQICPVGALTSPSYRFQARPFDLTSTEAVCNHCASGCNLRIDSRRNYVTRQLARDNDDVNQAWNCDRGRYGFASAQDPERVLAPLVNDGGRLRTASWPEALRRAVDGIRARRRHGAGVLVGGHLTDQDAYALQKLARVALGTNSVDARTWPGTAGEEAVDARVAGSPPGPAYRDLDTAGAVVVVDLDPHEESPILYLRLRRAALLGARVPVIAVGSRPGRLAEFATVVHTAPGGQAEALEQLGRGEGEAGRLLPEDRRALVVLAGWRAAATGGLLPAARLADRLGGRFAWVPRRAGDRGALDAGARPYLLPGGRRVADPAARDELAAAWGAQLPPEPGLDAPGMVAAAAAGELGTLVVAGVDLTRDLGPREQAEAALARAFVIAVDHQVNDTTRHADVLLPAVAHAESEGTWTDWEGRVQASRAALQAAGTARTVWELADQLAGMLGSDLGLATAARVAEEAARLRARPAGLVPPPLPAADGGGQAPPAAPAEPAAPEPAARADGQPGAEADGGDPGGAALALVSYPLLLDGASMLRRAVDLERATVAAFAEVHPDEAGRLGLADGSTVELDFGENRAVRLPLRVAATTAPGCVFVPANQPDLALGAMIGPARGIRVAVRAVQEAAA